MRSFHLICVFFICISCSKYDPIEDHEYEILRDTSINQTIDTNEGSNKDSLKNGNDSLYNTDKYENGGTTSMQEDEKDTNHVRSFSILGNSISTYSGYIPDGYANYYTSSKISVEETWWMLLSAQKDFELASNASWAGSTVINNGTKPPNSFFTAEDRLDMLSRNGVPDVILMLGGTNDWGDNAGPLGNYPKDDNFDLKTFRGAYSYLIVQLKKKYPTTTIICCSILPRKQSRTQKNKYGVTQQEIDESISYICNIYNVLFIDMSLCGLEKDINGLTIDGLHPNKEGMKVIANYLYNKIKSLVSDIILSVPSVSL